jgi:hypothetical protein
MDTVAYLYLETPDPERVPELFETMLSAGLNVDAFGLRDPPRKWTGDASAMAREILSQRELNKWSFFSDRKQRLSLDLVLRYDRSWGFSTLSLGGPNHALVSRLSLELARRLNPFLALQGSSGGGKNQAWVVLHEREDCPPEVRAAMNAA